MKTIKEVRESFGLSQTEFAKLVGVPQPRLCNWETGLLNIGAKSALKISKATGLSINEFEWTGIDKPSK